ncbi:hypothetical protein BDV41DRAFT_528555 [Aspergillus transmontanensis]|uniref:Uncharacterized protein n=1 Tax=Aspergillus transmontanensis TaxID=1034304 RepID=A0A5N6WAY9_9EURO|nr:hypothetical protein BDV41DRAFT_528555 [Aspergillus transmontanensis]
MPPITKLWLSRLKAKDCIESSEFTELLSQILTHCSSYTNPESNPEQPPMHAFFHSVENPDQLLMITGYPSQEMNNAADGTYAKAFLPRMFELVQHRWLKQLDLDVCSLPLADDDLVLQFRDAPADLGADHGGWDVWPETEQGIKMKKAGKLGDVRKTWVTIGKEVKAGVAPAREAFHFRKVKAA